jgi:ABC-type nitrate/sulfonate/bicarbonate transport system substrate-binding protein
VIGTGQAAKKFKPSRPNRHLFPLLLPFLIFVTPLLSQAQEKKALRVVSVSLTWNNQLPFRVAIAKGFFKDQGLSVETIFVRGGPTAIAALVSGNVDFAHVGGSQATIRVNARGLVLQTMPSHPTIVNLPSWQQGNQSQRKNFAADHWRHRRRRPPFLIRVFLKETT